MSMGWRRGSLRPGKSKNRDQNQTSQIQKSKGKEEKKSEKLILETRQASGDFFGLTHEERGIGEKSRERSVGEPL